MGVTGAVRQLRFALRGGAWVAVYLVFVLAPLFAVLIGPLPPSRDFWTEFSIAIGYSGLAMMGLQFGLTARFRYVTAPWGEDVIYHLHRQISLLAIALVVAHPLILFAVRPELTALLNSFTAPWRARFAALSTYSLIALVAMALWRGRWKIRYETWHALHIALAVTAVAAGLAHMVGWSVYLEAPWKRALWVGLTVFWIGLLLYVRIVKPLFQLRRPYRVSEVRQERGDSVTLAMTPDGHAGFRFQPGQFGWLTLWGSPFQITGHPFSFSSSAAAADGRVEMTIRKLGDFTSGIASAAPGQRVFLDGPYGAFTASGESADMLVLIAGGIGVTPMMSIVRTFADKGDKRPVLLLYGSRTYEEITFREELQQLAGRVQLKVVHVLRNPHEGWTGERGYVDVGIFRRHLPPPFAAHEYFICGQDVMMDGIERALGELDVPMSRYHSERYSFV
jgi:predicted ferric reductase